MRRGGGMVDEATVKTWFFREVFPLEAALTRFIRRNWRDAAEVADIRQEVYARVYVAARAGLPLQAKPFVFTTARNHLINLARHARIVSIDYVADLDALEVSADVVTPERRVAAREELRRLQAGLDRLPPRCREVVVLRRIEGLSQRETAMRLGVSISSVEHQLIFGMRALVDFMMGGTGQIVRAAAKPRAKAKGDR